MGGGGRALPYKLVGGGQQQKYQCLNLQIEIMFFYGSISYHAANHCFANK